MAYFHTTVLDNQIKALPTVDTASGSVATFDTDMTENLVKCVCEVASGASEINVVATGKNLFDKSNLTGCVTLTGQLYQNGKAGVSIDETSTGWESTQQLVNYGRGVLLGKLPQDTYTISFTSQISTASLWVAYTNTDQLSENTGLSRTNVVSTSGSGYKEITFNADGEHYYWFIAYIGGEIAYSYSDFMLEKGSRANTYEPFGTTINIPFDETLSDDGTFDVLSGILTRSDDTTKQLSSNYIQTKNGENNIWCDTGDTEVKYLLSVGKKIS